LRKQEAVLTSRMEGTISTLDEILQYDAESSDSDKTPVRNEVIETLLYHSHSDTQQNRLN
jgi:hypothetical protein